MQSLLSKAGRKALSSQTLCHLLRVFLSILFKILTLPINSPYLLSLLSFNFLFFFHSMCHHLNTIYVTNIVQCLSSPAKRTYFFRLPLYLQRHVETTPEIYHLLDNCEINIWTPSGSRGFHLCFWAPPSLPGLYPPNITLLQRPSAQISMVSQIIMNLSTNSRTQRKSGKTPKRNVIFYATCTLPFPSVCKRSGFVKERHRNLLQVLWITAEVQGGSLLIKVKQSVLIQQAQK